MKLVISLMLFIVLSPGVAAQVIPLPTAHSHNDYEQKNPLQDALRNGFTSVEADILYIYGKLFVGHNMPDSRWHSLKKLKKQYLKPLFKRYKANNGFIYPGYDGPFYLWIDIKFEPQRSYRLLRRQLLPYKEMLTYAENGQLHPGKVTVILSGARPFAELLADSLQLMTLDGRPEDLPQNYPTQIMPFISENAGKVCQVNSYEEVDEAAIRRIYQLTAKAKAQGKKVRLWATPEDEQLWTILQDAGVGLINTDDLGRLRRFLLKDK